MRRHSRYPTTLPHPLYDPTSSLRAVSTTGETEDGLSAHAIASDELPLDALKRRRSETMLLQASSSIGTDESAFLRGATVGTGGNAFGHTRGVRQTTGMDPDARIAALHRRRAPQHAQGQARGAQAAADANGRVRVTVDAYDDGLIYLSGSQQAQRQDAHEHNGGSEPHSSGSGSTEPRTVPLCSDCAEETATTSHSFELTLFLLLHACRLLNALLLRTFFQPDEYWQSQEIAHKIVFGFGYRTWEWRSLAGAAAAPAQTGLAPDAAAVASAAARAAAWLPSGWRASLGALSNGPIRGVTHALFFVPSYYIVKLLKAEDTWLLVSIS